MQKITIRPNLNNDRITVHKNRLGKVLKYVDEITIECLDSVVRKAGNAQLQAGGHKTVHAGLYGVETQIFEHDISELREIKYNVKKAGFYVNGKLFKKGYVKMINHKAYEIIKGAK